MKLWAKLTLTISLIVVILFSICNYLTIQKSFNFAMQQIIRQYQIQHSGYRIFIEEKAYADESNSNDSLQRLYEAIEFVGGLNNTALYTAENEKLYSSYTMNTDTDFMKELITLKDGYRIKEYSDGFILGVVSTFIVEKKEIYFITVNDINHVFVQKEIQYRQALLVNTVLLICVIICVWIFSKYITSPLQKLSNISERIAGGSY